MIYILCNEISGDQVQRMLMASASFDIFEDFFENKM